MIKFLTFCLSSYIIVCAKRIFLLYRILEIFHGRMYGFFVIVGFYSAVRI
jgi:hypothetical protein